MPTALLAAPRARRVFPDPQPLPFHAGDVLDQPTFHHLSERLPDHVSERLPDHVSAELVGGVVIMPLSVTEDHGSVHADATMSAGPYRIRTPGVEVTDNSSVILGPASEPHPDVVLRLAPDCGGQAVVVNHHITAVPELVMEVSVSAEAPDLGGRRDYQQGGVQEYVVVLVRHRRVVWFDTVDGQFVEQAPDSDGVYRSRRFPGFWLDRNALLERDGARLLEVLQQGLDSPAHAAFVAELAARRAAFAANPASRSASAPASSGHGHGAERRCDASCGRCANCGTT